MRKYSYLILTGAISLIIIQDLFAQGGLELGKVLFTERNLSGPRMGITFIPKNKTYSDAFEKEATARVISQFGWHFEHQITPQSGGPSFVIEWIPLVGGVETGDFITSLTLALGVRMPDGFEFGMGPNIVNSRGFDFVEGSFSSSLVIAVGKTFDFNGISIPFNFAYVHGSAGARFSVIFGYAIQRNAVRRMRESGVERIYVH